MSHGYGIYNITTDEFEYGATNQNVEQTLFKKFHEEKWKLNEKSPIREKYKSEPSSFSAKACECKLSLFWLSLTAGLRRISLQVRLSTILY
jgi:hypothetical protein